MDAETRAGFERNLILRLKELDEALRLHDAETSRRLPADDVEAAPLKSEMDIVESEEKSEIAEARLIRKALEKLRTGAYGTCEACGTAIPKERLKAVPHAERCIACQSRDERRVVK